MADAQTELEFGSEFQLLVAVVLSAQCTDKRINQVTPELFRHYPDAKSMAKAEVEEVLEYIKSVSYPNAKAEHLVAMARMLTEKHDGEVPSDMNQLLELPGVGRKTANVIQSVATRPTHLIRWNRNWSGTSLLRTFHAPTTGCCCMDAMSAPHVVRIVNAVTCVRHVRHTHSSKRKIS